MSRKSGHRFSEKDMRQSSTVCTETALPAYRAAGNAAKYARRPMGATSDIWAVIPVKETGGAKQRLGTAIPEALRSRFALAMLEDVLAALSAVPGLAGIGVVTLDAEATRLAERCGARVFTEGAREGQTGAVACAARLLAQ